jgi:hypothetical protein
MSASHSWIQSLIPEQSVEKTGSTLGTLRFSDNYHSISSILSAAASCDVREIPDQSTCYHSRIVFEALFVARNLAEGELQPRYGPDFDYQQP